MKRLRKFGVFASGVVCIPPLLAFSLIDAAVHIVIDEWKRGLA